MWLLLQTYHVYCLGHEKCVSCKAGYLVSIIMCEPYVFHYVKGFVIVMRYLEI